MKEDAQENVDDDDVEWLKEKKDSGV